MSNEFTPAEQKSLTPFFTNLDRNVFGLKLPQEVAGALFSRYSRSTKSLRRTFLDEFLGGALARLRNGLWSRISPAARRQRFDPSAHLPTRVGVAVNPFLRQAAPPARFDCANGLPATRRALNCAAPCYCAKTK